jgi:hypothetical protein
MLTPFNVSVAVVASSSGTTYSVQHTFDDTSFGFISSNATWFNNTGISSAAGNSNGNYAFPVTGIRINVTAGSSTVTCAFTAIQAGGV